MEKVIGPTISVSVDGYYITGKATDTVSGTAGYCYNTSTSAPNKNDYTSVTNCPTSKYTASQYHVTASNTYRFHAIDTAGNHNYDSTAAITYYSYHCNYCGQNTNSLTNHYRCRIHYSSLTCGTFVNFCSVKGSGICGGDLGMIAAGISVSGKDRTCVICGKTLGTYSYVYAILGSVESAVCSSCGREYPPNIVRL